MRKYYIPIIGAISAGKSTFLKAFLGVNVLETGLTTTTKFICLIKDNDETKFYHVIPKKEKTLIFEKEGEETKGEENIQKRIEKINEELSNNKGTPNNIFYILETKIKTIENIPLLEQCFFMDIPGLNEDSSTYVEDIFSLITIDDILFEIVIFDATSVENDNIKNIFKKLEKKKCLTKKNNIYILNKIDQCTKGGEEDIIDIFKTYFYQTFEKEKDTENEIKINIYDNYFIPMNSILYNAECRIEEDFKSALIFELYSYLEYKDNTGIINFYEFIKKRTESLIEQGGIDIKSDLNSLNDKDIEIINNILDEINTMTKYFDNFSFGVDFKNKRKFGRQMEDIKKFFVIHKSRKYIFYHSDYYNKIQEIIKNININNNDLSSPPGVCFENKNINHINNLLNKKNKILEIDENKNNKNPNKNIKENRKVGFNEAISDFEKFIKKTLKKIDKNKEMKNDYSIEYIKQNMSEKKIRVAFIGNMSVGKSTVLNAIIGEEILPTSQKECTYRGVILKYNDSNNYKLYKTNLIKKGKDLDEYYIFEPDGEPVCEGKDQIKSFLKNKNNDKKIDKKDAFFIITGKLRIFDFIELNQKLINRIEFIDLPGHNRENNEFNKNKYYKMILRFTNCCVYINESKSIEDEDSCERMRNQYQEDKQKVLSIFRNKFIVTCLFLINKCDEIVEEKDRVKIKNKLLKNISSFEQEAEEKDINISFFSGKCFNYYLEMYYKYVINLEISPLSVLQEIFLVWHREYFNKCNFYDYMDNNFFRDIEKKLELDLFIDVKNSEEFKIFSEKFKEDLEHFYTFNKTKFEKEEEESEIINQFYLLNHYLKTKDFQNTNYSCSFFEKLKTVIINSSNLQKENFKENVSHYFKNLDILFSQKYEKNEQKIKEKNESINTLYKFIEIAKELFGKTESDIKNCINDGIQKCLNIIKYNILNAEIILKKENNNIEDAANKMQQEINQIIEDIKSNQIKIINSLTKNLEILLKDRIKKIEYINNLSIKEINVESENNGSVIFSLFTSSISGVAIRTGLVKIGEALAVEGIAAAGAAGTAVAGATGTAVAGAVGTAGTASTSLISGALIGPLGIALGIGVGIAVLGYQLYQTFNKISKYEEALKKYMVDFKQKMEESQEICLEDFNLYKNEFFKDILQKIELLKQVINETKIDEKEWKKIQKKYSIKKENLEKIMKDNIPDEMN